MGLSKAPFVWELTYKGVASYAVGTMHVSPANFVICLDDLLGRVERVAVEFDHADQEKGKFVCNDEIGKRLGASEIKKLAGILGLSPETLARDPLVVAHSMLITRASESAFGKFYRDGEITDEARKRNLDIISLETAQEQALAATRFYDFLSARFERVLSNGQDIVDLMARDLKKLTRAYWDGNVQNLVTYRGTVSELSLEDLALKFPEMVEDRSVLMAERSIGWLNRPTMISVGISHYITEPSILTVYRTKGVEIRKIE